MSQSRWYQPKVKVSGQPSIFDQRRKQAEVKAQVGIEASYQHADTTWKAATRNALRELCQRHREFTTDQLWDRMGELGIHTGEPRALGAIIQSAYRSGMIQKTGQYKESYRRHNAPIPVWRSNIWAR